MSLEMINFVSLYSYFILYPIAWGRCGTIHRLGSGPTGYLAADT